MTARDWRQRVNGARDAFGDDVPTLLRFVAAARRLRASINNSVNVNDNSNNNHNRFDGIASSAMLLERQLPSTSSLRALAVASLAPMLVDGGVVERLWRAFDSAPRLQRAVWPVARAALLARAANVASIVTPLARATLIDDVAPALLAMVGSSGGQSIDDVGVALASLVAALPGGAALRHVLMPLLHQLTLACSAGSGQELERIVVALLRTARELPQIGQQWTVAPLASLLRHPYLRNESDEVRAAQSSVRVVFIS